jgi:hypothetical protein
MSAMVAILWIKIKIAELTCLAITTNLVLIVLKGTISQKGFVMIAFLFKIVNTAILSLHRNVLFA